MSRKKMHVALPTLNEDIILQILHKLPHKSLLRFSTASKQWLAMITNPNRPDSCYSSRRKTTPKLLLGFINKPNTRSSQISQCFETVIITNDVKISPPSLSLFNEGQSYKVCASSNSYLLCHRVGGYCVINPFTQQQIDLPLLLPTKEKHEYRFFGFECCVDDPNSPLSTVRFSVILFERSYAETIDLHLFESNRAQWRKISLREFIIWFFYLFNLLRKLGRKLGRDRSHLAEKEFGAVLHGVFYKAFSHYRLIALDKIRPGLWTIKLPHSNSGGSAICAYENRLFYGVNKGDNTIQVFVYEGDLYLDQGRWELEYEVRYQDIEDIMKDLIDPNRDDDCKTKFSFTGFHTGNPYMIYIIFHGKLMSYDVNAKNLWKLHVIRSNGDIVEDDSLLRLIISCESSGWPHSLPCIPS